MEITIRRLGEAFLMEAENETGNTLLMDAAQAIGGGEAAFRPMQMLLTSLGGCSTIDVLMILKKQRQHLEKYEVRMLADREAVGEVNLFRRIVMHFHFWGKLDAKKVEKAVHLSVTKYCSVAKMLEPVAEIDYKITIHAPE